MIGFTTILLGSLLAQTSGRPIILQVNATEAPRNMVNVVELIPAKPGPMVLRYPKWIPGEHMPTGTINNVVNLHVLANGREIPWSRDPVEMFDIRIDVPAGVNQIQVTFINAEQPGDTMTSRLARLKWNRVVFAPKGNASEIAVRASVRPPKGWTVQTALPVQQRGEVVVFKEATLERLVDSPLQMGLNAKTIEIAPGHFLDMLGDERANLEMSEKTLQGMKNLVVEARALWGAQHYREYHWLLTFSAFGAYEGLEHHESSEDGEGADALKNNLKDFGDLVSHEYTHSWNGKYRRPKGLATPDYMTPQRGSLLWVYEGMTQYWGYVLPARSGLWTFDQMRDTFLSDTAQLGAKSGRTWRNVEDTATSVSIARQAPGIWGYARRRVDYYSEGAMFWLEADATIRKLTNGARSLDNFCSRFYGGQDTGPKVVPYSVDDVIRALNSVAPYDWKRLIQRRVYSTQPGPPTGGLEAAGWRMVFTGEATGPISETDRRYDLGLFLNSEGKITDMNIGSPADRAGVAPEMKILAIGDKPYSAAALTEAVKAAKGSTTPIRLQVQKDGVVSQVELDYHEGPKYPRLERISGTTDYLSEIGKPKVARN